MYKLRVAYTIEVEAPAECDAVNIATADVPDNAKHLKIEVTGHFNHPPKAAPEAAQAT